jgi:hypothetical protein
MPDMIEKRRKIANQSWNLAKHNLNDILLVKNCKNNEKLPEKLKKTWIEAVIEGIKIFIIVTHEGLL